jgi:hypothetical protein
MSLSLSVLAAILFLAPGIAGFLGSMIGARSQILRASFPPANSLVALIAVVLIAVAAHGVASGLLAAQTAFCRSYPCFAVSFDPNAYKLFIGPAGEARAAIAGSEIQYALIALTILSIVSGLVMRGLVAWDVRRGQKSVMLPTMYGWVALYDPRWIGDSSIVIAYVLTKMRGEDLAIGYRGMVEEISLTADKEISTITLVAADRFGLSLKVPDQERSRTIILTELLPRVYIPGREIENIVLNVVAMNDPPPPDAVR